MLLNFRPIDGFMGPQGRRGRESSQPAGLKFAIRRHRPPGAREDKWWAAALNAGLNATIRPWYYSFRSSRGPFRDQVTPAVAPSSF